MKKFFTGVGLFLLALVLLAVVVAGTVISVRNKIVVKEEDVSNQWSQVENQYQRRFDLIPNLVSSVRGYMDQEQDIFTDIADARTRYSGSTAGSADRVEAANDVESSLGRLLVIMESYPELKSDQTVSDLMTQLEGTENRISVERSRYNDVVTEFNQMIRVFPNSAINSIFLGFDAKERFESVEGADVAPTVDLSDDEE